MYQFQLSQSHWNVLLIQDGIVNISFVEQSDDPTDEPAMNTPIKPQVSSYGSITDKVRPCTAMKCSWPMTVLFVSDSVGNKAAGICHQ